MTIILWTRGQSRFDVVKVKDVWRIIVRRQRQRQRLARGSFRWFRHRGRVRECRVAGSIPVGGRTGLRRNRTERGWCMCVRVYDGGSGRSSVILILITRVICLQTFYFLWLVPIRISFAHNLNISVWTYLLSCGVGFGTHKKETWEGGGRFTLSLTTYDLFNNWASFYLVWRFKPPPPPFVLLLLPSSSGVFASWLLACLAWICCITGYMRYSSQYHNTRLVWNGTDLSREHGRAK